MIIVSVKAFGISLATWHIKLSIDLPTADFKKTFSAIQLEITTGPRNAPAPVHSEQLHPAKTPNAHEPPTPGVQG